MILDDDANRFTSIIFKFNLIPSAHLVKLQQQRVLQCVCVQLDLDPDSRILILNAAIEEMSFFGSVTPEMQHTLTQIQILDIPLDLSCLVEMV